MDVFMKDEDGLRPCTDSRALDFGDVFGGPPRRPRRPYLHRDDFFDDIFRGHDQSYSSPWKTHPHHQSRYYNI